MKIKMSEFSRLTGFKRTTLQLYDRKGLLKPVSRTESGYWEYDSDSLVRANMICVMKECGFTLEEIKQTLGSEMDAKEIFRACGEKLRLKIRKLNGYAKYIRASQINNEVGSMTEPVIRKMNRDEILSKPGGLKSEMEQFLRNQDMLEYEMGITEEPDPDTVKVMQALQFIGLLNGKEPPEGEAAQETLRRIFACTHSLGEKSCIKAETVRQFVNNAKETLKALPEQAVAVTEQAVGKGCMEYIQQALDAFGRAEDPAAGDPN